MNWVTFTALLATISLALADLPSCDRARCVHCEVEFIARMCPAACSACSKPVESQPRITVETRPPQPPVIWQPAKQVSPVRQAGVQTQAYQAPQPAQAFAAPVQSYPQASTLAPLIEQPNAEHLNPQLASRPADLAQPIPEYQQRYAQAYNPQQYNYNQGQRAFQQPAYNQGQAQGQQAYNQFGQTQNYYQQQQQGFNYNQQQSQMFNPFQPFLNNAFSGGQNPLDPLGLFTFNQNAFTHAAPVAQVAQPARAAYPAPTQPAASAAATPTQGAPQPFAAQPQANAQVPSTGTAFNGNFNQPIAQLQPGTYPQAQLQAQTQTQAQLQPQPQPQLQPQPQSQAPQSQNQVQPQPNRVQPTPQLPQVPQLPQMPNFFQPQLPPSPPAPHAIAQPLLPTAQQPQPQNQLAQAPQYRTTAQTQAVQQPQQSQQPQQAQLPQLPQQPQVQQPYPQPQVQQALPSTSNHIDSSPAFAYKYGAEKGPAPAPPPAQCPRQPGWAPCISKDLANERFRNCCARLGDGCSQLCNYDASLATMQLAVLTGRCPLNKVADMMVCASGYEDATPCCEAYNVFEPGYEQCRPYCNPAAGLPQGGPLSDKYKCLVKLSAIQQCFYVSQKP